MKSFKKTIEGVPEKSQDKNTLSWRAMKNVIRANEAQDLRPQQSSPPENWREFMFICKKFISI